MLADFVLGLCLASGLVGAGLILQTAWTARAAYLRGRRVLDRLRGLTLADRPALRPLRPTSALSLGELVDEKGFTLDARGVSRGECG